MSLVGSKFFVEISRILLSKNRWNYNAINDDDDDD